MKIAQYHDVHHQMRSGDVIAFAAKDIFSTMVRWGTQSTVSHVGVVAIDEAAGEIEIVESHPLSFDKDNGKFKMGVQRNRLLSLIEGFQGQIWWLPLSDRHHQTLDQQLLTQFLQANQEREYDFSQAILSGLDFLDDIGLTHAEHDRASFFCSELVATAFQEVGILREINPSEITPIDLCRFSIYHDEYYLLTGEAVEIPGYNSQACTPERDGGDCS